METQLCCLIGNPIKHSLSPTIHNAGFKALDLPFAYLAFKVINLNQAVKGIRVLGIRGVSVTAPYKVEILKYLDEIEATAKKIGAVNTVVNNNGILRGYNTDCSGAIKALKEVTNISGKKVVLLGAGGAARAIVQGLKKQKAKISILNRTVEKAEKLARIVKADNFGNLNYPDVIKSADILINATCLGMSPRVKSSPVPKNFLHKKLVVFDIVYNPRETKLIKEAKTVGCKIVYGYKMFLYQAACQFELFTGHKSPMKVMEKALLKNLGISTPGVKKAKEG